MMAYQSKKDRSTMKVKIGNIEPPLISSDIV